METTDNKPKTNMALWNKLVNLLAIVGAVCIVLRVFFPHIDLFRWLGLLILLPLLAPMLLSLLALVGGIATRDYAKVREAFSYITMLISGLNPFLIKQSVLQMRNMAAVHKRYPERLPDALTYVQAVEYSLPFSGEWTVVNGGINPETSHSWDMPEQRYAYDFVITDSKARSFAGQGWRLKDYYCFAQPILAPADGVVVEIKNNHRDAPIPGVIDLIQHDIRGNYIVIQHAAQEYSILAHLKRGSVGVKVGQTVKRGQPIAQCGSSGNSTEPHLHFSINDRPTFFDSMSLPVRFSNFQQRGALVESGYLTKNTEVSG